MAKIIMDGFPRPTELKIAGSLEGIGNEKKPTLIADFQVGGQSDGLFVNRSLNNVEYISHNGTEIEVSSPTALLGAGLSPSAVNLYQIDFSRLPRSVFEFDYISLGGEVSHYDLHDGVGDSAAICALERFAKVEK